jgi:large subunit GTPase 1
MSNKQFEVERANDGISQPVTIVKGGNSEVLAGFVTTAQNPQYTPLRIPRRPEWTTEMSAEELDQIEKDRFIEWRRDIANIEESNSQLEISPFEKNLEVWRQLWRVIERSQLLIQIVDARNPYFFYSEDLEKYIEKKGDGKQYIVLLNKADFLTEDLIHHWD